MSATPIYNPGEIISAALYGALAPVAPLYQGIPAAYWRKAADGAAAALAAGELAAMVISQPQATLAPGGTFNEADSSGPIVIRAIALTDDGAQAMLAEAVAAIVAGLAAPSGLAIYAEYTGEPPIPPADGMYTAAAQFRITIRRD